MHHGSKNFSILDYVVFIALLFSSSLIGIFFAWRARHAKNSDHFFTGGRKLAIFPVTMSLVASFMSTNTLLGVPAEVFQVGTQFIMQIISITLAVVIAAEVFMPVYYNLEITSVNEYLMRRFNSKAVKLAGSLGFLVATVPYMAVVLYGPSIALSSVTPISITTSILLVGVICTFYTSIGGIKAVIWTDVLQCILMFLGVAIVIIQGLMELGGLRNALNITEQGGRLKLFNFKFDLYNHDNFWNVVIGTSVQWGACYCISQTQVQRYMSMKSRTEAKRTLYYNLPGLLLLAVMSILSGVVIYGKYHDCDPVTLRIIERHDQLMPYFVMDTLSQYPGVAGLFVSCVFSGALSTLSSGFNALAAVTWEDLLKDKIPVTNSVTAVKLIAMAYGLLAIGISFCVESLGTVMQASIMLSGSIIGPLFGLFTIAILCRFVNAKGAFVGIICGFSVAAFFSMGQIIFPRPHISLTTTTDHCPIDIYDQFINNRTIPVSKFIPYYENPQGIGKIVHISYFLISVAGYLTSLTVGIVASLLTGGVRENEKLDDQLLSPLARYLPFGGGRAGTRTTVTFFNSNKNGHVKGSVEFLGAHMPRTFDTAPVEKSPIA